jgi:hypothetical protein
VERARRTLVVLALAAIAAGAFQPFYLTVWKQDWRALGAVMTELPYRKVPGLRRVCLEAARRTPPGSRILLVTSHPSWPAGYDYAFRRAHYLLAGREMIPMLGEPAPVRPDYVVCVAATCAVPTGYRRIWSDPSGALLERIR